MTEAKLSFWRRHRWIAWVGGGCLLALAALAGTAAYLIHHTEPFLRARVVDQLQHHFHARVELDRFHVSLAHGISAEGEGLRIWPSSAGIVANSSLPEDQNLPIISLNRFRFHAPLRFDPNVPLHVSVLELTGMEIHVPPRSRRLGAGKSDAATSKGSFEPVRFEVDTIQCTGAHLFLETDKPGKLPMDFPISHFMLDHVSSGSAMGFDAELINDIPTGFIHSTGAFGPWAVDDPGGTPIQGRYTFDHADLGDFKDIAGILSSTGEYQGTLRNLTVDGETDTPDFQLTAFGTPLPLHTKFHAHVDGTNGDTHLDMVDAMLDQSHFIAQGDVIRVKVAAGSNAASPTATTGHDIRLDIDVDHARIEDFLRLASKSHDAMLLGPVAVKAKLHIPPGKTPVPVRLELNGTFTLNGVRFVSTKIQDAVRELSVRGQGHPKEVKSTDPLTIRSVMHSDFQMASGVLHLPNLVYEVPGAAVHVAGTYGIVDGALNFAGTADLEAKISQMVGGIAGLLLKPADRFFDKNGPGTQIPIKIQGTRKDPQFSLNFHHEHDQGDDPGKGDSQNPPKDPSRQ